MTKQEFIDIVGDDFTIVDPILEAFLANEAAQDLLHMIAKYSESEFTYVVERAYMLFGTGFNDGMSYAVRTLKEGGL